MPQKPEADGDDVTLKSLSPHGSISSVDYEPLQTPVPESRKAKAAEPPKKPIQDNALPVKKPEDTSPVEPKPLPFGEPVGPGGGPLKHSSNAHPMRGVGEGVAGQRRLPRTGSRQRIVATVEQPAMTYKTTNGSSNSLITLSNSSSASLARTILNDSTGNVARKVVKFEDEVAIQAKKTTKEKSGKGEGDGGSVFAKRFSFDGKGIRDRLPHAKRSSENVSYRVCTLKEL